MNYEKVSLYEHYDEIPEDGCYSYNYEPYSTTSRESYYSAYGTSDKHPFQYGASSASSEDMLSSTESYMTSFSEMYSSHATGSLCESKVFSNGRSSFRQQCTTRKPWSTEYSNCEQMIPEETSTRSDDITQEIINKVKESELEDILQHARDIVNPDPTAKFTYCAQPAKVLQGSFRHMLSIKEMDSQTGAFKYRTIEVKRQFSQDLGFSIRQGDGWEKESGIYISRVSLDSIFDKYEILTVGDEVMTVNKVDVKCMDVKDVIKLMHMPERLCVTIKMLTPFSRKRTENSGFDAPTEGRKYKKAPHENIYKVAQMTISSKSRTSQQKDGSKRDKTKTTLQKDRNQLKISPYRAMEGGMTTAKYNKFKLATT